MSLGITALYWLLPEIIGFLLPRTFLPLLGRDTSTVRFTSIILRTYSLNLCFLRGPVLSKQQLRLQRANARRAWPAAAHSKLPVGFPIQRNYSFQHSLSNIYLTEQHQKKLTQLLTSLLWPEALIRARIKGNCYVKAFPQELFKISQFPKTPPNISYLLAIKG